MLAASLSILGAGVSAPPPEPFGPLPTAAQMSRQKLDIIAFLHFSINTFTDKEWGYGDESPELFHPTDFDAESIVKDLKDAGMEGIILTAKHHDGFCLWPTSTTSHSVRSTKWRDGEGDVVGDLSEACRKYGVPFGVYLSPWDRNHPEYGRPKYLEDYRTQLRELLTGYGPMFEVWFDGANGGDGYYGGARETRKIDSATYYRWPEVWAEAKKYQPNAVPFSDVGPGVRWVGNESGIAAENCWATFRPRTDDGSTPAPGSVSTSDNQTGDPDGELWLPAEADVSIRPGWFWHAAEDGRVKTGEQLMDIYLKSVGRGALLLLNVPPDRRGRIDELDKEALRDFQERREALFARDVANQAWVRASSARGEEYATKALLDGDEKTYWATPDDVTRGEIVLVWREPIDIGAVRFREPVFLGQRIRNWSLETWGDAGWQPLAEGQSVGLTRIWAGEPVHTSRLRLVVSSPVCPALSELAVFEAN